MRDTEIRKIQSLERIDDFATERAAAFPPTSLGGQKFAEAKVLLLELHKLGEDQSRADGAARASAEAKRRARTTVQRMMRAIRDTAKAMEAEMPGISDKFRVPTNNGDEALINAGRSFVTEATPLKANFIQHELPTTFLEDLSAAIGDFESADSNLNLQMGKRVSTTAGIKSALLRAAELKRILDPVVRNRYRDDPASLAAWESASRVERSPKRKKKTNPPPPKSKDEK